RVLPARRTNPAGPGGPPRPDPGQRVLATARRAVPGLLAAALAAAVAVPLAAQAPQVSTLLVAVVLGVAIGNGPAGVDVLRPGLALVARVGIRLGVVLLGFRLAVGDVGALGWSTLALVLATVTITFVGTQAVGRRLGLSRDASLLVATGFSICGASAIAAMAPNTEADEEEVAVAVGLVTLAGTLLMLVFPLLAGFIGLSDAAFGTWVGASGPDVAQVVAAASNGGSAVLSIAVVVKLSRIVLLAPLVTAVGIARSRRDDGEGPRPATIPIFVAGFLVAMVFRSLGVVPEPVLDTLGAVERSVFALALVGLGSGVRLGRLRRLGPRPLLLGASAWLIVGSVSLVGALLIAP
ncbi:MAG: putative sulfate exporter family transporter, partial [Actinomycetota bacterium]